MKDRFNGIVQEFAIWIVGDTKLFGGNCPNLITFPGAWAIKEGFLNGLGLNHIGLTIPIVEVQRIRSGVVSVALSSLALLEEHLDSDPLGNSTLHVNAILRSRSILPQVFWLSTPDRISADVGEGCA